MTRAVGIAAAGGPEVLGVIDRPTRPPGPDEVRIAVRAAGVNPTDVLLRRFGTRHYGCELPAPWTPGMDAAGVIESVGADVERLRVGEQVMAAVLPIRPEGGAQAEMIVVPAASVVAIPRGASFEQAATLPMNGLTAMRGLELLGLESGATLAVTGAAGLLEEGGTLVNTRWLEHLRELASDGRLQLRVAATFAPEQTADAQELTDGGGLRGRAVIVF